MMVDENDKPVTICDITYCKGGNIKINDLLCDSNTLKWTDEKVGKERILTISGLSAENYPVKFECRSKKKLFGYDNNSKLIDSFKSNIDNMLYRKEVMERLTSPNPIYLEPPSGLSLKKGEGVLTYDTGVSFSQMRSETHYKHLGGSYKVTKNFRVSSGRTTPVKSEVRTTLDTGTAILTNKRFVFVGSNKTVTIELNKIVSLDYYADAIHIAKEGAQKQFFFSNLDGNLYHLVITSLI